MNRLVPLAILGGFLVVGTTGCTSPKYKSAPKKTPPPVMLNLPSTEPPLEAVLHTVIIYRGPGSWKLDAFWDEYVVTVSNRGHTRVAIESATVTDFRDETVMAGEKPWDLEKASRIFAEQEFASATMVEVGNNLGAVAIGSGVSVALAGGAMSAGTVAAGASMVLLPAVVGGSIYSNITSRKLIEREFARRRLVLPATLQPGQFVQGSFFFRISPGPKRLMLRCRIDGEPHDVTIDLAPLAGIHLQRIPPVAPSQPGTPQNK